MGREIKFRTWEPPNEMGKTGYMSHDQAFALSQILHPDGCIVMQYTGLKDKHGIEIYEGDIYQHDDGDNCMYVVRFVDGAYAGQELNPKGDGDFDDSFLEHPKYVTKVIVGNIYANPEICQKKKEECTVGEPMTMYEYINLFPWVNPMKKKEGPSISTKNMDREQGGEQVTDGLCDSCRFFERYTNDNGKPDIYGLCHRYPPSDVAKLYWCREYKKKEG